MHKFLTRAPYSLFWYWINERHKIYLKRKAGELKPWTNDVILQEYKFTNVFRELDKTTVWMRKNLTRPNAHKSAALMIFNCCVFRLFGTIEMNEVLGWVTHWNPKRVRALVEDRLKNKRQVFTGAYMITNAGRSCPKSKVVVDHFLTPIWENRVLISNQILKNPTLENAHVVLGEYEGFGGGGFMAYEVVSDLRWTPVLDKAKDKMTWANPGPGCIRGLKRLYGNEVEFYKDEEILSRMKYLLKESDKYLAKYVPSFELREIEHSLCEFDKYCRVEYGEGRPRSRYDGKGE